MERPELGSMEHGSSPQEIAAAWGLDFDADLLEISRETEQFFGDGQCHALAAACAEHLGLDGDRVRIIGTSNDGYAPIAV